MLSRKYQLEFTALIILNSVERNVLDTVTALNGACNVKNSKQGQKWVAHKMCSQT